MGDFDSLSIQDIYSLLQLTPKSLLYMKLYPNNEYIFSIGISICLQYLAVTHSRQ